MTRRWAFPVVLVLGLGVGDASAQGNTFRVLAGRSPAGNNNGTASDARFNVPTGVAVFPNDVSVRRLMERENTVTHWTEFDRGGHFAAMEAPDLLVQDVRELFATLS